MQTGPIIKRSDPPQKAHYSEYTDDLRRDFFCSCAYCFVMEKEAGGVGFSVEHYIPKSTHQGRPLEHDFMNLLWACDDCNSYKGTYLADDEAMRRGLVVIRPDKMDPFDHLEVDDVQPTMLKHLTDTGRFNIAKLDLNRPGLQRIRAARLALAEARKFVAGGIAALSELSVDRLKPAARGPFIKLRNQLISKNDEFKTDIDDLLRDYARSPLRMPDPDARRRARIRKRELMEMNR